MILKLYIVKKIVKNIHFSKLLNVEKTILNVHVILSYCILILYAYITNSIQFNYD